MRVVSAYYAFAVTAFSLVVFWLAVAGATWQFYGGKIEKLWNPPAGDALPGKPIYQPWTKRTYPNSKLAKDLWTFVQCINPLVISQDSLGYGSLSRFQILLFTTVVGGVLFYVFIHSGVLSDLSTTTLTILGITVGGGTLGRAVGDWNGIKIENRQWLIGGRILQPQPDRPRWSDLLNTQGEIDVAKVQALLFTALIAISIVSSGYVGLNAFNVPDQIMVLSLISQGAFVAGKLLPTDSRRKIDEDIDMLRKSGSDYAKNKTDPDLKIKYDMAVVNARITLMQTYGDKFNEEVFDDKVKDPANVA